MVRFYSPLLSCQSTCYFLPILPSEPGDDSEPGPEFLSKVLMPLEFRALAKSQLMFRGTQPFPYLFLTFQR